MVQTDQHRGHSEPRMESQVKATRPEHPISHAQGEAFKGLESFQEVRAAMAPQSSLQAFDQGRSPTVDFSQSSNAVGGQRDKSGDVIKPDNRDRFKTPEIHPDTYQLNKDAQKGRAIDENGRIVGQAPEPNALTAVPVGVQKAADGSIKSVSTLDPLSQAGTQTFEINAKGMARIREYGGVREVEQFAKDGKPVSREVFLPGASGGIKQTPDKQDRLSLTKNPDGSTVINSQDHGHNTNTSIVLDKDGNAISRSVETPKSAQLTEFNPDGKPKSDTRTDYDANHKVTEIQKFDKDSGHTQVFDKSGNVIKDIQEDDDNKVTNERRPDGTQISTVEDAYGGKRMIVNSANGERMELSDDGAGNRSSKITRPDGSSFEMTENANYIKYKQQDSAGNWRLIEHNKQTGVERAQSGDADSFTPRITRVPI